MSPVSSSAVTRLIAKEPEITEEPEAEALTVDADSADLYGYVGEKDVAVSIAIAGGAAPYQVVVASNAEEAQTVTVEAEGVVDFTYVPTQTGDHEITVTVTDAEGVSVSDVVSVPVAGKDETNV